LPSRQGAPPLDRTSTTPFDVSAGQEVRLPAFDSHEIVIGACAAAAGAAFVGATAASCARAVRTHTTARNSSRTIVRG